MPKNFNKPVTHKNARGRFAAKSRGGKVLVSEWPSALVPLETSQDTSTEGMHQEPKGRENIFLPTQISSEKLLGADTGPPWTRVQGWRQFLWCCRSKVFQHTSESQVFKILLPPWMVDSWEWNSHRAWRFRGGKADGIKCQLFPFAWVYSSLWVFSWYLMCIITPDHMVYRN